MSQNDHKITNEVYKGHFPQQENRSRFWGLEHSHVFYILPVSHYSVFFLSENLYMPLRKMKMNHRCFINAEVGHRLRSESKVRWGGSHLR